jgi:hypothetical protein
MRITTCLTRGDYASAMTDPLSALAVVPKTGAEHFHASGEARNENVLGFWRWSSSDLVGNAMRGVLAEYIVGMALGCVSDGVRMEWDAADLLTADGLRVEVKSAAYLQSWAQSKLASISFGIQPTKRWDAATNTHSSEVKRQADVYVFCVLHHEDKHTVDPLDLDQWTFFVLSTDELTASVGPQKSISLNRLRSLHPRRASFAELAKAITAAGSMTANVQLP